MEVVITKIIVLSIMFTLTLVFGLLPIRIVKSMKNAQHRQRHWETVLGWLNCFGGGVFFGTFLIHLIPEVRETFENALKGMGIKTAFPLAEFVIAFGFFFVLILEHVIGTFQTPLDKTPINMDPSSVGRLRYGSDLYENHNHIPQEYDPLLDTAPDVTIITRQRSQSGTSDLEAAVNLMTSASSTIRAMILLIALGFHSMFAGLAVGLQMTTTAVWTLFIAIDSHKFVVAFSVGLEIAQAATISTKKCILYMCIFSLMTPIGVAIGIGVTETNIHAVARDTSSAALQALATGTFIYVTFFEVLVKQLEGKHDLLRIFFVLVGFGFMTAMKFLDS